MTWKFNHFWSLIRNDTSVCFNKLISLLTYLLTYLLTNKRTKKS